MSNELESYILATENPYASELHATASAIATIGKGILAADESTPTIGSRFSDISVENTAENRRAYRELLFTTPNLSECISGVILYSETLNQSSSTSELFTENLKSKNIKIGAKVDLGTRQLPFAQKGHKYSVGFENLEKTTKELYTKGVRFVKWRSVLSLPSSVLNDTAIKQVAREQALYAAISQQNGLVPIVEPELLTDGSHSRKTTKYVTQKILAEVFKALNDYNVDIKGILLKPSMVLSGKESEERTRETLKERIIKDCEETIDCLKRTVPPSCPGIMFLSGGQGEEEATLHLNEMNKEKNLPWIVSFSYGRALQAETLKTWGGKKENVEKAQKVFHERFRRNGEAQKGMLEIDWSKVELGEDLFVKNYTY